MRLRYKKVLIVFIGDVTAYLVENAVRTDIEYQQFRRILNERKAITFYNWECPIRSDLREATTDLGFECDWLVDDNAFSRTRLVDGFAKEKEFVERVLLPLREAGLDARYYKFVADTNPEILYPATIDRDVDKIETARKMVTFVQGMQDRTDSLVGPGTLRIMPFSIIKKNYSIEYDRVFNDVRYSFFGDQNGLPLSRYFPQKLFRNFLEELVEHGGLSIQLEDSKVVELGIRVVSSYAAEEAIIRKSLAFQNWFRNPVALPNESMFTFPRLANAYLGKDERGPWLFVLFEGGKK